MRFGTCYYYCLYQLSKTFPRVPSIDYELQMNSSRNLSFVCPRFQPDSFGAMASRCSYDLIPSIWGILLLLLHLSYYFKLYLMGFTAAGPNSPCRRPRLLLPATLLVGWMANPPGGCADDSTRQQAFASTFSFSVISVFWFWKINNCPSSDGERGCLGTWWWLCVWIWIKYLSSMGIVLITRFFLNSSFLRSPVCVFRINNRRTHSQF